jgi:hypothetical protein
MARVGYYVNTAVHLLERDRSGDDQAFDDS